MGERVTGEDARRERGGRERDGRGEAATNWCFFPSSFSATAAKVTAKKAKKIQPTVQSLNFPDERVLHHLHSSVNSFVE